jgi:WD40 repeat protein
MPFWHRLLREMREIVGATARQTARLIGYGYGIARTRVLLRKARGAQLALGNRMYEAGLGDEAIRGQITSLDDRIASVGLGKGSTKQMEAEKKGLMIRLAADALAQDVAPTGAAAEHGGAIAARDAIEAHRSHMESTKAGLAPEDTTSWRRIGLGYGVVMLALAFATTLFYRSANISSDLPSVDVAKRALPNSTQSNNRVEFAKRLELHVTNGLARSLFLNPLMDSREKGSARSVAFSPDGRRLAAGFTSGEIKLWDLATGEVTASGRVHANGGDNSVAFSPDGLTLASGGNDGKVKFWMVTTGELSDTIEVGTSWIGQVVFSPDGKTLATTHLPGITRDGIRTQTVRLWDVGTGRMRPTLRNCIERMSFVAFSPDGKTLATGGEEVSLWDVTDGSKRVSPKGHTKDITSLAFSSDGRLLATGSKDKTVRLWDVTTGRERNTFTQTDVVDSVAFTPDGQILVAGDHHGIVRLWDVAAGRERTNLRVNPPPTGLAQDTVWSVAISPDGKTLATSSVQLRLWDLVEVFRTNAAPGEARATLRGHESGVESVAFSPDGKTLASASWDKTVRL